MGAGKINAGSGWILPEKVDKAQMGQYYEGVRKGFRDGSFSFANKLEMTNF